MYTFNLDREAKRHVEYLLNNTKKNWTYWDVTENHSKTFTGRNIKIKAEPESTFKWKWKHPDRNPPLTGGGPGVWKVPSWDPQHQTSWGIQTYDFSGYFWDPRMQ